MPSTEKTKTDFEKGWESLSEYERILIETSMLRPMIAMMGRRLEILGRKRYRQARNEALEAYKFEGRTEEERLAYKKFLNNFFNIKAVAGTRRKHDLRVPLEVYEAEKH